MSKMATSQYLPQKRQHHNTAAQNTYLSQEDAALTLRRPLPKNVLCQSIWPLLVRFLFVFSRHEIM
jgi:hypothetical protein